MLLTQGVKNMLYCCETSKSGIYIYNFFIIIYFFFYYVIELSIYSIPTAFSSEFLQTDDVGCVVVFFFFFERAQ